MGEFYTVLVDHTLGLDDAQGEATRMVAWLQAKGIIGPAEAEDAGSAGSEIVYRPGPNFLQASDDADDPRFSILRLQDNYLEVVVERTVFHAGDNGIGIHCHQCATEQTERGHEWNNAFQTWWEGRPEPLICVECGYTAHLSGWRFDPVFGFGNLGFSFHNWSLRPGFIEAFERELGRSLTIVHQHP